MGKKQNIKIFVSHRIDINSEIINNPLYINVRCGAVFDNRGGDLKIKQNMLGIMEEYLNIMIFFH